MKKKNDLNILNFNLSLGKILIVAILFSFSLGVSYSQTRTYTYDNLGRLTQAQYPNGTSVQYSYDANGNRLQHIVTNIALNVDLSLNSLSLSSSALSAGSSSLVNVVNANGGNAAAPNHQVNAYLSTDNVLSVNDLLLSNYVVASVNPNASFNISNWNMVIPNGTSTGNYFLILKTDGNNSIAETNENNNLISASITISACSNISITETVTSASCGIANGGINLAASGGSAAYQYSVNNGASFQTSSNFSNISAGSYTCQVKDANACTNSKVVNVSTVGGNTTIPNFTYASSSQTITFTNTSQNATSYLWDFGDGNFSSSSNPSHTFASSGNYNVCLTATNSCGSNQYCSNVNVGSIVVVNVDTMRSWEKQYWIKNTSSTERFFPSGIAELSDSSIITVGEYYLLSNGTTFNYPWPIQNVIEQCIYISKTDKNGLLLWVKKITGQSITGNYSVGQFGNVHLNVLSNNYIVFNVPTDNGNTDIILTIDANGSIINTKKSTYSYGGIQIAENNIYTVTGGYVKLSCQVDFFNPNGDDITVVQKFDNNFNLLWTQSYRLTNGSFNTTIPKSLIELTNGDLFIVGVVGNNNVLYPYAGSNDRQGFYLKISSTGNHIFHKIVTHNNLNFSCLDALQSATNEALVTVNFTANNNYSYLFPGVCKVDLTNGNLLACLADTTCCNLYGSISQTNLLKIGNDIGFVMTNSQQLKFINLKGASLSAGSYPYNFYNNLYNSNTTSISTRVMTTLGQKLLMAYTRSNAMDGRQCIVKLDTAMTIDCADYRSNINLHSLNPMTSTIATPQITNQVQTSFTNPSLSVVNITLQDTILCNYHEALPCNVTSSFTKSSTSACLGDIVTFTNTSINGPVLLWRVNGVNNGSSSSLQKTFLTPGNYTIQLIASDFGNCPDTSEYYYTIAPQLSMTNTITNVSCGQSNGSIVVNGSGGTSPLFYSINNGNYQLNSNFSNLTSATYTLRVKDANNCSASNTATLTVGPNNFLSIESALNLPACTATCNGTAVISTTGGNSPYSYAIIPTATQLTTGNFSGLCANTIYTVTSTDATGCSKTKLISLTSQGANPVLSISVSPNDTICYASSVTLTASGASTYSWSGGISNGVSFIPSSTTTYTVTGTDNVSNCTSTASQLITVNSCGNCLADITISTTPFTTPLTESQTWIKTSGTVLVPLGANVRFDANLGTGYVALNPGFKAEYGAVFVAQAFNGCANGSPSMPNAQQNNNNIVPSFEDTKGELVLYPNPTSGMITLQHPSSVKSIQVFDMVGKLIINVPVDNVEKTDINLSDLPNGIYHVRTPGFSTIKVIKQ